ncbi:MAG TPA: cystathionine beta-lyase [Rickettsiales bacterium]|nr:cystathionine beta-lyase [Rickettsiales bacterium]
MKKETLVTTIGRNPEAHEGVVNPPVYRASTILFPTVADYEESERSNGVQPLVYARSGTPATRALEEALAQLDEADHAIVTSSGQSAILVAITAFLSSGDHLLVTDNVYGSMRKMCKQEISRFGIEITFFDPLVEDIRPLLRPNTKMVYCEAPGSQTFEVQDIPAIVKAAHAHGAIVVADNTWATPLFNNMSRHGVDISIQSCTKYISGHSDLVMGLITCSKQYFPALRRAYRNYGACPGSEEIYLAQRGLRTLATRLKQHQETGLKLAQWFKQRPETVRVLHPALPECPGHEIWKRDFTGASGLFGVLLKPYPHEALARMLDHMKLFGMGFSWGGYESLMIPFKPERTVTQWKHDGICLRVHAGLEAPEDLIADLEAGFARLNG